MKVKEVSILIVAYDVEIRQFYKNILTSQGYSSQDYAHLSEIFNLVANSPPDMIIILYEGASDYEETQDFLSNIHQMYNENNRPLILLLWDSHVYVQQLIPFVDEVEQFLITGDDFIKIVNSLMQKRTL